MTSQIITVNCGPSRLKLPKRDYSPCYLRETIVIDNSDNRKTPCECYQEGLELVTDPAIDNLIYFHSDVTVHDEFWLDELLGPFFNGTHVGGRYTDSPVVAVGMGGATSLGRPELYKVPYNIWNLARGGYASNQTDAETHGERLNGVRRVAVLDAFCMAVRRDFLVSCGGWPVDHLSHHALDLWLACEARRRGKEIWTVGVSCTHHGGGVSTRPEYASASWLQGGSMESDHATPHHWIYNEYRDVLPFSV